MIHNVLLANGLLSDTAALAAVALIGYVFGRRTRQEQAAPQDSKLLDELARAQCIAKELEHIALRLRTELAGHQSNIGTFQAQVQQMQIGGATADWQRLSERAEALLLPTIKLATNLSVAYDQLRSQQAQLITFSGSRIDAATGLHNRRSMEEQLEAILSTQADGKHRLALALFSLCSARDAEGLESDHQLRAVANVLEDCVRGNDFAARYSQDEFVVLMPKTTLSGALVFCERLIRQTHSELGRAVWGGVVEAAPSESPQAILSRADSALYSARTHDKACLFQHTGSSLRRYAIQVAPAVHELSCGEEPLACSTL